jgi:predicted small lipoprotein YifL
MLLLFLGLQGCGRKGPLYLPPGQAQSFQFAPTSQLSESSHE